MAIVLGCLVMFIIGIPLGLLFSWFGTTCLWWVYTNHLSDLFTITWWQMFVGILVVEVLTSRYHKQPTNKDDSTEEKIMDFLGQLGQPILKYVFLVIFVWLGSILFN